ncbi:PEP-CTERM sorting domain-containing protein [Janthinobacterium sp. Mn2066]|uniref:PEP-CTERM sorting domain-containing protein n=1 Tax=Janthinobacterium sp. Mn2066 TaxID=3395264 RepID=UPI003BBBEB85
MNFVKLSGFVFFLATLLPQSDAIAEVQEITIKNAREKAVLYSVRYFREGVVTVPAAGNSDINGYSAFARLYESFALPEYSPGYTLSSATLNFSYKNTTSYGALQLFGTKGGWTTFDWYHQPETTTGVLGVIPASAAVWKDGQIDVTDYINNAYKTGSFAGFVFQSPVEFSNWTDVAEFRPGQTLSLTFTSPVPEPENYAMLLMGLGLIGFIARRKRR